MFSISSTNSARRSAGAPLGRSARSSGHQQQSWYHSGNASAVEADHVRQHHAHRLPVARSHSWPSAGWPAHAPLPASSSRWPGPRSLLPAACAARAVRSSGSLQHAGKIRRQEPPGLAAEDQRDLVAALGDVRLQACAMASIAGQRRDCAAAASVSAWGPAGRRGRRLSCRRRPSSLASQRRISARTIASRCPSRPSSARRSSAAWDAGPCRLPNNRCIRPPLVWMKLMPLAQSRELPPPSPTSRSGVYARAASQACRHVVGGGVLSHGAEYLGRDPGARSDSMPRGVWPARNHAGVTDHQRTASAQFLRQIRPSGRSHPDRTRCGWQAGNRTEATHGVSATSSCDLVGPGAKEEVDQVSFVRLQPIQTGGRYAADVQAITCVASLRSRINFSSRVMQVQTSVGPTRVTISALRALHYGGEGEHVFLLRDLAIRRIAVRDDRAQVRTTLALDQIAARTGTSYP